MPVSSPRPTLKQHQVGQHVRHLREQMRISVRALAGRTDFSPSFISQLENGQVSPSIHSMEKIAHALGATLGSFFAAIGPGEGGLVLRKNQRERVESSWSNAVLESLGRPGPQRRLSSMLITLAAGGQSGKHPVSHATEEFAILLKGKATLRLGPDEHILAAGDSVTLLAGELRLWLNEGRSECQILIVGLTGA
jgi:transcriptional regulator with XRE-family HTH domain